MVQWCRHADNKGSLQPLRARSDVLFLLATSDKRQVQLSASLEPVCHQPLSASGNALNGGSPAKRPPGFSAWNVIQQHSRASLIVSTDSLDVRVSAECLFVFSLCANFDVIHIILSVLLGTCQYSLEHGCFHCPGNKIHLIQLCNDISQSLLKEEIFADFSNFLRQRMHENLNSIRMQNKFV